jgi:hypothetical protein
MANWKRLRDEAVVARFKVIFWHSPGIILKTQKSVKMADILY